MWSVFVPRQDISTHLPIESLSALRSNTSRTRPMISQKALEYITQCTLEIEIRTQVTQRNSFPCFINSMTTRPI